jgi:hypothetical protein
MTIRNEHFNPGLSTPGRMVAEVTPHDTNRLPFTALTIYIGTGGTITYTSINGDTVTQTVPDYWEIPIQTTHILATGTTASNIVIYG